MSGESNMDRSNMNRSSEPVDPILRGSLIDGSIEPDPSLRRITLKDLLALIPEITLSETRPLGEALNHDGLIGL